MRELRQDFRQGASGRGGSPGGSSNGALPAANIGGETQRLRNEGLGTLSEGAFEAVVGANAAGGVAERSGIAGVDSLLHSLLLAVLM